jgi:hypothetical protein
MQTKTTKIYILHGILRQGNNYAFVKVNMYLQVSLFKKEQENQSTGKLKRLKLITS